MAKQFILTWTPPTQNGPFTDYSVQYAPSGQVNSTLQTGSGDPAYRLSGLTDFTVYQVRVAAHNVQGVGTYSDYLYKYASQYPSAPQNLLLDSAASGEIDLTWDAPEFNGDTAITDYEVVYTPSGESPSGQLIGSTNTFFTLSGLDCGKEHYVVVSAVNVAGSGLAASGDLQPACQEGIVPVADNQVRFYVPSAATGIKVNATSSTGYCRLTDGTNDSTVIGNSSYHGGYHGHMYSPGTLELSTLVAGDRVVRLFPCDAAGTYDSAATIQGFSLINNPNEVTAVDFSHCSGILYAGMMGSTYAEPRKRFGSQVASVFPSGLTEVRAVGVKLGDNPQNYNSGPHHTGWHWVGGGADCQAQALSAAAIDQFYEDLISDTDTTLGTLIMVDNPGTGADDPTIATAKGYTVES